MTRSSSSEKPITPLASKAEGQAEGQAVGSNDFPPPTVRLLITGVLLILFVLLIWTAARSGFARLLQAYAVGTNQIAAANAAVELAPSDPETHYARAAILEAANDLPAALAEYDEAVSLRVDDYVLWLRRARAREINGNSAGAIADARQAVKLAPYYARPRWQLGNLLLRAGLRDEAFRELRQAGVSNPVLLPAIIDLAWQLSAGDAQFVLNAIQPQVPEAYKGLAEYFRKRDKATEAISMFRSAGMAAEQERLQYLTALMSAGRFKEAYALWSVAHAGAPENASGIMIDPGFEREGNLAEQGFGWHGENRPDTVSPALDSSNPKEGRSSLRIEFKGGSDPVVPAVSQLVLLDPSARYQLRFAARTENIVSGGMPRVSIIEAGTKQVLGQTLSLPHSASNWQEYTIDFKTLETTTAVQISLHRESCSQSPCPIFGKLWLDDFSMKKL